MSSSRVRNIKWLGIPAYMCSPVAAVAAGDTPAAIGIVGASLPSAGVLHNE